MTEEILIRLVLVLFSFVLGFALACKILKPEENPSKSLCDLTDEELAVVEMAVENEVNKRMGE